ncbi:MAG: hypothetical protein ACRD16_06210 [Thermoanaerobaculia bacterium]
MIARTASAQSADAPVLRPVRQAPVLHDVSPPLRSIPPARHIPGPPHEKREPGHLPPRLAPGPNDPVTQTWNGPLAIPSTSQNFEGMGNGFSGPQGTFSVDSAPPDIDGDIGPNHYVQIVNTGIAVFDRSGNVIYGPVPTQTLWSGFGGGCQTNDDGDGSVKYDKRADRWVITQFSVSTTPYKECLAVSTTGDPTGSYSRYAYTFSNFPDYPKLAVWPDGYYITYNMFNGNNYAGGEVCAYDRSTMLSGGPATQQCFGPSMAMGGSLPSDLDGPTDPPAGSPDYVLTYGTNSLDLWKVHVDWGNSALSSLTGPTSITTAAFTPACNTTGTCIPQKNTAVQLDSLSDRLMLRLGYRNFGDHEVLVANQSVLPSGSGVGVSGVRWYEIRSPGNSPSVFQQGTYAPADGKSRWMGSIAMDGSGDIGLGYSISSGSMFPSISYTGRLVGDPLETLPQGEASIQAGSGSQTTYTSGGKSRSLTRWGDYSSLSVDPVDDCTFWYTDEYLASTGAFNWQTRIGSFKFPSCGNCTTFPAAVASGSSTICSGNSTPLSGSGGASCAWSPATGLSSPTSCTPTASPASTTIYTLSVTDASGCSSTNDPTVTITVNPKPTPTISASGPTTFCQGGSVTLDAGAGYSSYLWSPGGATTRTIGVSSSGSHSVTVTNSNGCSGTSNAASVTVNALPTAVASGSATICAGSSTALSGSGGVSCSWSPSTGLSSATSCSPSASPSSTTTYTLTVTSSVGCTSTNAPTVTVTVNTRPTASASGSATICAGSSTALSGSGGVSCSWSPSTGLSSATSCSPSASPSSTTTYTLTVTGSNGCSSTNAPTAKVTVNTKPATPAITAPSTANPGDTGLAASVANHAGSAYAWSITNGSITGGTGTSQITFTAGADGTLTLQVVETDSNGCSSAVGSANVTVGSVSPPPPPTATKFYTLTPCRILDTRNPAGPYGGPSLSAGGTRTFVLAGQCGIPVDAIAVSVNITVVLPSSDGSLKLNPAGVDPSVSTAISFASGRTLANNAMAFLGAGGDVSVEDDQASGSTNFIIDTNGYFK